ncbi:MAG: ferrous iron transport protein B [Synechococcaceae cyanobacterium]|nr:ferrous iron transport protein B [Synechococcaceae cyanobacterium]
MAFRDSRRRSLLPAACHGTTGGDAAAPGDGMRRYALFGLPNTGKSTLFNRLTGGKAQIANWPGLTVDLLRGSLPPAADGCARELVDLPGIHDLRGGSADEAIALHFLHSTPPDGVIVVLNASQIVSQLTLLLQMQALGLPTLLVLNMSDEARRYGVHIDTEALAQQLGIPVVAISARHGQGLDRLRLEVDQLPQWLPPDPPALPAAAPPLHGEELERRRQELIRACVALPQQPLRQRSRRLDRLLLHPLVGPLLFLLIVLAMFQLIYAIGAPLQDGLGSLIDAVRIQLLEPLLSALSLPQVLRAFLLDGVWLGIATVTSFLPIIFLFYLVMALVEDSGYLPRAAFLMDGFMHWLGLDGRAFVLQIMGFGCNVPAIMGTRIIRDPAMRLLAMIVIPFALCQARLTVFLFMAAVFFPRPWWAPGLVVFGFYLLSFVAAIVTGLLFRHLYPSREAFVLELPPYRRPGLRTMLLRAWREMINFLVTTRSFIVLGAALIWLLTHLPPGAVQGSGGTIADWIGGLFQPLLAPIGMNPALTVSLFFGFIAKEILLGAMAVIYRTHEAGLGAALHAAITPLQALSFMTFTLLYTPCLSTVAIQIKEARSRRFGLISVAWSLALAWLMAFAVYQLGLRFA